MKTIETFFAQTNFVEVGNKLLREIINENPDFQYNNTGILTMGCHYNRGVGAQGIPSPNPCDGCLFGQMFQRWGISKKILADFCMVMHTCVTRYNAPEYWAIMQSKQDEGAIWGKLLRYLPVDNCVEI